MATGGSWPASSLCLGAWQGDTGWAKPQMLRCYGQRRPHLLGVGPSGSGKTWTWVLPTLLSSWFRSVFVFDVKGDLYEKSAGYRATFSHVIRLSLTEIGSARYNLMDNVRSGDFAVADAKNLAENLGPDHSDNPTGDKIWDIRARGYFAAAILWTLAFAEEKERNLRGVASLLSKGKSFAAAMHENAHPDEEVGRFIREGAASLINNESEKFVWSVLGTLDSYLEPYRETILARNTLVSDFKPSDLMTADWPVSVYVCVPVPDLQRMQPFLRALIAQLLNELQYHEKADRDGLAKRHPLSFVIDEVADIGGVGALARAMPRMRSFGIRALLGCQTTAQLRQLCGHDREIINNSRLVCTRQNAIEDARMISELLGDAPEVRESVSRSGDPLMGVAKNVSRSRSEGRRRVMQTADATRLPDDRILIFGETKPIKAWRTPPAFWQANVVPPPRQSAKLPAPSPWAGVRYPTVQIEEIEERMKEEKEKAAGAVKPLKVAAPKSNEKPAQPARRTRL